PGLCLRARQPAVRRLLPSGGDRREAPDRRGGGGPRPRRRAGARRPGLRRSDARRLPRPGPGGVERDPGPAHRAPDRRPLPGGGSFADHVFGVVLVNDWSARDIQAWEYQPLGPFLGKSFATSISPWVVPLEALAAARLDGPAQDPAPLGYLRRAEPWALDLSIEAALNGAVVPRPP